MQRLELKKFEYLMKLDPIFNKLNWINKKKEKTIIFQTF